MRNIVSRDITIDPPNDDTFPNSSTVSDKAERESLDRFFAMLRRLQIRGRRGPA